MQLQEYLSVNRSALDAAVTSLVSVLATEDDTDRDRRVLARDTYKALQAAFEDLLANEYEERRSWGAIGEIFVGVYQPAHGEDLFGRFMVHAGRLDHSSTIPCPEDWPRGTKFLDPGSEALIGVLGRSQDTTKIITLSHEGSADLGAHLAGRRYVVEELPGGEFWPKPLEDGTERE